jgi:two-component system, OmpR family, phosphate regulon sensor histidine kinase PhoR
VNSTAATSFAALSGPQVGPGAVAILVHGPWVISTLVLAAALLGLAAGFRLRRRREQRYLRLLHGSAERFAGGELDQRISVRGPQELQRVAAAMNRMAEQLDDRFQAVERQRRELEAVLSSMAEGVVAVDADERIMTFNRAAAGLLGLDPRFSIGRRVVEVVRNRELERFISRALADGGPVHDEIILPDESEQRTLQATGTVLHDADDARIGALLVFNDITQLRRLESVRRDFVANVSHEMRTPLTAIKAAAETLLSDDPDGPDRERFLKIVQRNADRMTAIIEDLLALARLEQAGGQPRADLKKTPLEPVLAAAAEACHVAAQERGTDIGIACPPDLVAMIDPVLIEQAVVNLLDNAIKYGRPGAPVDVSAARAAGEVIIAVRDRGEGIPAHHLPRIFERFYRVDKGRSRTLGSTGLGLAIVKHICQAHGGRVGVESRTGVGTTFRIHLPGNAGAASRQP